MRENEEELEGKEKEMAGVLMMGKKKWLAGQRGRWVQQPRLRGI